RTMDGVVLGTPAYMPPEQARGEIEKLSPRSDVYSIGAMLYHLLARQVPYTSGSGPGSGARTTSREILERVRAGPPAALPGVNPGVPAELVAICERAMARDAGARYPDTLALAEDLRAYLEHRVVAAYETGALAELKKWIQRNRGLAAACAVAVLALAVGLLVSSLLYVKALDEGTRAERANVALAEQTRLASQKAIEAEAAQKLAEQRTDDVLSLSAGKDLQDLVARADSMWPARPENVPQYEAWLRDARALVEGRADDAEHGVKAKPGL